MLTSQLRITSQSILVNLLAVLAFSCKSDSKSNNSAVASESTEENTDAGQLEIDPGLGDIPAASTETTEDGVSTTVGARIVSRDDINSSVVNFNPGALQLEPVSFVPTESESGALGLAGTDMDNAEKKFSWNPAQEPLDKANVMLCIYRLVGTNHMANAGPYIAKVSAIKKCLSSGEDFKVVAGGLGESKSKDQPIDVTAVATKETGKALKSQVYFTVPYTKILPSTMPITDATDPSKKPPQANVYLTAWVAAPMTEEDPFGIFEIRYQIFKFQNGNEDKVSSMEGYLKVYKETVDGGSKNSVLDFYQKSKFLMPGMWDSDESSATGTSMPKQYLIYRARAVMKPKSSNASHGYVIDSSRALTSTRLVQEGEYSGPTQSYDQTLQNRYGNFAMVFDAESRRALSKFHKETEAASCPEQYYENGVFRIPGCASFCTTATMGIDAQCDQCTAPLIQLNSSCGAVADSNYIPPPADYGYRGNLNLLDHDTQGGAVAGTFNPEAPSCRRTDRHNAAVYAYGLFDGTGSELNLRTSFPVKTDLINTWGWPVTGWNSSWGFWISGVDPGSTVKVANATTGDDEDFMLVETGGSFRDSSWSSLRPNGDLTLQCSSNCPKANITDRDSTTESNSQIVIDNSNDDLELVISADSGATETSFAASLTQGNYSSLDLLVAELSTKLDQATDSGSNTPSNLDADLNAYVGGDGRVQVSVSSTAVDLPSSRNEYLYFAQTQNSTAMRVWLNYFAVGHDLNFKIERGDGRSCSNFTVLAARHSYSFFDDTITQGNSYCYRISAIDLGDDTTVEAVTERAVTTNPSNTGAEIEVFPSDSSIFLSWTETNGPYTLQRGTPSGGSCVSLENLSVSASFKSDNLLVADTAYCYVLTDASNVAVTRFVSTMPHASIFNPVSFSGVTQTGVNVNWAVLTGSYFQLSQATGPACSTYTVIPPASDESYARTSYVATALTPDTEYCFRVVDQNNQPYVRRIRTLPAPPEVTIRWSKDSKSGLLASLLGFNPNLDSEFGGSASNLAIAPLTGGPLTFYTYNATQRKLYREGVHVFPNVSNIWLSAQLTVTDRGAANNVAVGDTLTWEMSTYRNEYSSIYETNGQWFDTWSASSDSTAADSWYVDVSTRKVKLNCASNCPKVNMTKADIANNSHTQGATTYYFSLYDYALYASAAGAFERTDANKVAFASNVRNANLNFSMVVDGGPRSGATVDVKYIAESSLAGPALQTLGGSPNWVDPDPILKLKDRSYSKANDSYYTWDNELDQSNNALFSTLSYGGLSFDGANVCCFSWESFSGVKDQWGGDRWLPKVSLRKGTLFETANASANIAADAAVYVAPKQTELFPIATDDCSDQMYSDLQSVKDNFKLPAALLPEDQAMRDLMPTKPARNEANQLLKVRVVDGVPAI